jgi:hypothetical protein
MITRIALTYNRSGGCWTIAAHAADGSLVACKSHYGLKRQAQAWTRRVTTIVTLCQWARSLAEG